MRTTTTDPITGNGVTDTEKAPFVVEGKGEDALKIYFETEASRREYLDFSAESASTEESIIDAYNQLRENETTGTIN